ncbi:MAG TPA: DivIVA domain-containing protein [Actinomycetota bacterium]|nr:DivIVA domain-containing protein [Actinomycetota bacterium]
MELTPRDIQQKQFNDAFRGYSHEEVDAFLDEVAEAFSRVYRENQNAQLKLRETDKELGLAKQTEGMLKRTLLTAQQTVDETIAEARTRAEEIERVANARAAEIMAEAQARIMELRGTLEGLKRYERDYRDRLRAFMQNQLEVLNAPVTQPAEIAAPPPPAGEPDWPQSVQEAHSEAEPDLRPAPLPPRRQPEPEPATTPKPVAQESARAGEPPPSLQYEDLLSRGAVPPAESRIEEEVPVKSDAELANGSAPVAPPTSAPEPAQFVPIPGGAGTPAASPQVAATEHFSVQAEPAAAPAEHVVEENRPAHPEPSLVSEGVHVEAGRRPDVDAGRSPDVEGARRPDGEAGRKPDNSKESTDEKSISELFWGED